MPRGGAAGPAAAGCETAAWSAGGGGVNAAFCELWMLPEPGAFPTAHPQQIGAYRMHPLESLGKRNVISSTTYERFLFNIRDSKAPMQE